MTQQKSQDKNLQNVAGDLKVDPVNAHNAQQLQQDVNDRKKKNARNHNPTDH
jgi:hypothetical protein